MGISTTVKSIKEQPKSSSRKRQRISEYNNSGATRRDDDDGESDLDSYEDQVEVNTSKIADTIGGTISRLIRVSNAARKSAKAD